MAEKVTSLKSLAEFLGEPNIKVVVPKIQRAYAQGRTSEVNIRSQFVDEIFNALESGKILELSFVYGSKVLLEDGKSSRFELLDGQQRITTLVLLHWFLACVTGREIPEFIRAFSYETRTTSETFLKELANNPLEIGDERPSDSLRNRQWYTLSFDKDNSVRGMLIMLDAIYSRYKTSSNKEVLYNNLSNIKFYELDLDDFGLTEEIYVKMNARGLQLTPFENFKADLTKLLKDESVPEFNNEVEMEIAGHPIVPYYLSISQKIDNRWLDIFWNSEDTDGRVYCDRFFRFFYRFFTTKFFLEIQKDLKAEAFRPKKQPDSEESKIWNFLWVLSPEQDKNYLGFKYYDCFFRFNPNYIKEIEKILDVFSTPEYYRVIMDEAVYPWDRETNYQASFFEAKYQHTDAVYFAAVCEYIKRSTKSFDIENFKRWMRVVRNIVENLLFRNVDEVVRVVRRLTQVLELPGAMHNVYQAMASDTPKERDSRSLKEEMHKASIIINDPAQDWEDAFTKAELHPFFRGSIGFILENLSTSVNDFAHRVDILSQLFDKNGMTNIAMDEHRLIRSMARLLNTKELLNKTVLTEREDTTHHLKVLMLEKNPIRKFMSELGDKPSIKDVISYLDSFANTETIELPEDAQALVQVEPDAHFLRAFHRLCLDGRVYDFIQFVEKENGKDKYVEVSFRDNNIALGRPGSWYNWLFIGNNRTAIINELLNHGYVLQNANKAQDYNLYGDYTGFRIWLEKAFGEDQKLTLEFNSFGKARFLYRADDTIAMNAYPNAGQHETYSNEGWRVICEIDGSEMKDLQGVLSKTNEIENKLTELALTTTAHKE